MWCINKHSTLPFLFRTTKIQLMLEDNKLQQEDLKTYPRTLRNTSLSFSCGIYKIYTMLRPSLRTVVKIKWYFKCEKNLWYILHQQNFAFCLKIRGRGQQSKLTRGVCSDNWQNQGLGANLLTSSPNRGVTDNSLPGNKAWTLFNSQSDVRQHK